MNATDTTTTTMIEALDRLEAAFEALASPLPTLTASAPRPICPAQRFGWPPEPF